MQGLNDLTVIEEGFDILAGLVNVVYDTVRVNYTDSTKEFVSTIEFFLGGTGGVLVETVTATYPDADTEVYTNL